MTSRLNMNCRIWICLLLSGGFIWSGEETVDARAWLFDIDYLSRSAEAYFDSERNKVALSESDFEQTTTSMKLKYGLDLDITLVLKLNFVDQNLTSDATRYENSDLGDSYIGLVQKIPTSRVGNVFFTEVGVFLPEGYDQEADLPLGSGGISWYGGGTYAQYFGKYGSSIQLEIAYLFRNEGPDDEFWNSVKWDWGLTKRNRINLAYFSRESDSNSLLGFDPLKYPNEHGLQWGEMSWTLILSPRWQIKFRTEQSFRGRNYFKTQGYGATFSWLI